jgi:hypothetical protein
MNEDVGSTTDCSDNTFVVLLAWPFCMLLPWHKWLAKFKKNALVIGTSLFDYGLILLAPASSVKR